MANRSKGKVKTPDGQQTVVVSLDASEAKVLIAVADYYQKAMGPVRHLVRATAPRGIRAKFRFVAEESRLLMLFAENTYDFLKSNPEHPTPVKFTVKALVAFWGRLLSSLKSNRSRRRMTEHAVREREALAGKLAAVVVRLHRTNAALVEAELETRRLPEAQWMRERLMNDEEGSAADAVRERS